MGGSRGLVTFTMMNHLHKCKKKKKKALHELNNELQYMIF